MTLPRRWGRGTTVLVLVVVALALAGTAGYALTHKSKPAAAAATTAKATRGTVTVDASAAGTVNVVTTRGLSFAATAVVTEIDVKVGDQVTAGQVLARVDSTDAQTAVTTAQQQVTSAQDNLTRAEQTAAPTPASTCVAAAAYLLPATASPSPSPSHSPSPSPSATGRPAPSSTGGPSRGAGPGSTGRPCSTGGTGNRSSTSDPLASAQQQFNNAQLSLLQAQQKLAGTVVTAPIAGRVISVGGTVGSQEKPGGTGFIVLGDIQDTEVQAQFSEADVAHLAVGQPATITLPNRTDPVSGKVAQISPAGTTSGRLVRYAVLIAFDTVPADLLFGQSASVAVTTAAATGVIYVPTSAVTGVNNDTGTVTVRAGGHDQRRSVVIGLRGDRYTEIKSGLNEGEQVVL